MIKSNKFIKPEVKYAKSGNINIAYQVFGSGNVDLVYVPGWISNIDWMWTCSELVSFLLELGKIARIILFDKRGTGLSDRVVEVLTPEERMEDISSVMNAAGCEKAILFGHSEGGSVSALFSTIYPNRVIALIAFGSFAKRRYSSDYPWAPTSQERQKVYDMIEHSWCRDKMQLDKLAPSKSSDQKFIEWLANYFRSGASPSAAMALIKMNTEINITDILGHVKVPTLIMHRTNDSEVKIQEGKFIARNIKKAKFVELEGSDHLFWTENTKQVLKEIKSFIINKRSGTHHTKGLFTILVGQITSRIGVSEKFDSIKRLVLQYEGKFIQYNNNNFKIAFKTSGKAVHCSMDLYSLLKDVDTIVKIGIYVKEVSEPTNAFRNLENDFLGKSIVSILAPDRILVVQNN